MSMETSSPPSKKKSKATTKDPTNGTVNTRTIKVPGSKIERVAQACDRCRAKKTKCDGKNPCSTCQSVGLECIVSDRLTRKSYPKAYTETLEERVRQLEAENKKLVGLLDMRDEQLEMFNTSAMTDDTSNNNNNNNSNSSNRSPDVATDLLGNLNKITASNLSLLDIQNSIHLHVHNGEDDSCPCGCSNPHAVHERPVSIAGSIYGSSNARGGIPGSVVGDVPVSIAGSIKLSDEEDGEDGDDDDSDSLLSVEEYNAQRRRGKHSHFASSNSTNRELSPAPGAFAAATAIAQMQKTKLFQQQQQKLEKESNKQSMLTSLVAISIPRSTEETLCIPTLLARICQAYGYDSKPAILTANSLASLKENVNANMESPFPAELEETLNRMIMNRYDVTKLSEQEAIVFLKELINLPVSRLDMDQLITVYFQEWGNALPILDKNSFLKNYMKLNHVLEQGHYSEYKGESSYELIEKFGAIMILILSLAFLASKKNYLGSLNPQTPPKFIALMKHYDYLIHEFIRPNCLITQYCSIQTLQILSLALQYCLVTGDTVSCYELRGRVISMAQQLRLHRCPAAVLGLSGNNAGDIDVQNFMQGERRILFWCIYCLDVYSALNLGIPRLFKDYEIECAMPFSGKSDDNDGNNEDNVNILIVNNTKLSIVGKVSRLALSVMLYCKVLANIVDSIYSRFDNTNIQKKALHRDRMLDCWRRELPPDLKFEMDINGLSLKDPKAIDGKLGRNYSKQQLTLIFLYYHAKILIYLPILSKFGNHHNVGLSQKEQLLKGEGDVATIVSSISLVQQSSIQILEVLKILTATSSSNVLPIPIHIVREQSLLALLVAKGTLDYIKGGPLFINLKQLLLDTMSNLNSDCKYEVPGGINRRAVKLLEVTILSILGVNINKGNLIGNNGRKKVLNLQLQSPQQQVPITKTAVERLPNGNNGTVSNPGLSRIRSANNSIDTTNSDQSFASVQSKPYPQQLPRQTTTTTTTTTPMLPQQDVLRSSASNNGTIDSDTPSNLMEDTESLEELLSFDPFKVNLNRQMLMNEFVTDGSLGLVPFLEASEDGNSMEESLFFNNNPEFHVQNMNMENGQGGEKNLDLGLFNQNNNFW
ncbi:Regulatory protein CAT8 [Candida viswanathii]|uniref:Regulatory protein CAT8 n=1 Tax=Candida viswanathii TaxID=5486 RepID=A0A367YC13_9ASCO|nr:Regulatory protein CAT8 [Candida viswanathii]